MPEHHDVDPEAAQDKSVSHVADGKFVKSCCDSTVLLELVDALDGVALLIDLGGECAWPPTV
jgi:hypothetical protein